MAEWARSLQDFFFGWIVQTFADLIETITPAIAKNTNARAAVSLREGLSITRGHLATGFGFADFIGPTSPQ
jgi:hypothetical protein